MTARAKRDAVRLDTVTRASRGVVVILAGVEAGWMVFDGAHALLVGDYVTPSSGEHAGELGPWSGLVEAVGIEPRSLTMKLIFVGYGSAWLTVVGAYIRHRRWARPGMVLAAAGSLWYLWAGTLSGLLQLGLLALAREGSRTCRTRGAVGGSRHNPIQERS